LPGVAYTVNTVGTSSGVNTSTVYVALTDPTQRPLNQQQMMIQVRNRVLPHFRRENLRVAVQPVNVFGAATAADSAGIQFVVRGPDLDKLTDYSQRLLAVLKS